MAYELNNVIVERKHKKIYRDGDSVIKLFDETYTTSDILNEALNHARAQETELNVPKLKEVLKIDGKWAIVTEFIEGSTISDLVGSNPEKFDEYMEKFVKLQAMVHSKKCALMNKHWDKMNRKICEAEIDSATRYELLMRLNSFNKQYSICHGDFNPNNIIITPEGEAYILDWSHVTQGDPCADVARTYLMLSLKISEDMAKKYLKAFCIETGADSRRVYEWLPIVACSQLVKKVSDPQEQALLRNWINVVDYE